jgi:CheY-like chemotaxis protein/two-component sensor histidine kinase
MMMQRQIEQMIRLVEDLLDVARISRNKLDLRKERTDVESIVRTAVETSRPVLEEGDHHLDLILPPTPLTLSADSVRLSQVFSNLLTNAARYSQPGSRISFEAREEGGELIVCVKDEGIGISADKLSKIFEMFVQLDGTDGQRRTGLGVGLTLVKTLVEMHGGKVEARSDGHGHGSEFIVRLPIVQASIGESVSASTSTATQTAPRRVLVVDDNVDSAESMAMILKLSGHEVALAHDGEQALQVARAFQPDVAFLDLGMPNVNGYEAARLIRKESWGERIMLVALTGWGQEEDKRRTLDAGFDLHVVKPIDFAKLDSLVSQSNQLISPNVEELSVSGDAVSAGSE